MRELRLLNGIAERGEIRRLNAFGARRLYWITGICPCLETALELVDLGESHLLEPADGIACQPVHRVLGRLRLARAIDDDGRLLIYFLRHGDDITVEQGAGALYVALEI